MTPARCGSGARGGFWPRPSGRNDSSTVKKARHMPISTIRAVSESGHAVTMAYTGLLESSGGHSGARPETAVADAWRQPRTVLTPPGH